MPKPEHYMVFVTRQTRQMKSGRIGKKLITYYECMRCGAEITRSGMIKHMSDIYGFEKDDVREWCSEALQNYKNKQIQANKVKKNLEKWRIKI